MRYSPAWWPSPLGTLSPQFQKLLPLLAPAGLWVARAFLLLVALGRFTLFTRHCDQSLPYAPVSHLFEECHLFPAGTLDATALPGVTFSGESGLISCGRDPLRASLPSTVK